MEFTKELKAAQKAYLKNENIQKTRNAMRKRQANRSTLLKLISCNVRYLCDRQNLEENNSVQASLIDETINCLKKLKEDAQ